jgi:GAF domain-containing protein
MIPYTRPVLPQDSEFLVAGMQHVANNSDDLSTVVRGLVQAAAACVGSNMGSLFLLDEPRGVLKPFVLYNLPDSYLAGCAEVPLGTQCCGRAALHKTPWIVTDMWTDPLFIDCREAAMSTGLRSAFSVPVLDVNGNCKGSLASHFLEAYVPTPYDLERQSLFAKLIAFALARSDSKIDLAGAASGNH